MLQSVTHGFLIALAGPIAIAASQNDDVEEPWVTYLHLWQAILLSAAPDKPVVGSKPSTAPKLGLYKETDVPEQLAVQQQAVYDALMRAVMDAVRNLDLEYHQAQAGGDVDAGAKVTSPDSKLHSEQVCVLHVSLSMHVVFLRLRSGCWCSSRVVHDSQISCRSRMLQESFS